MQNNERVRSGKSLYIYLCIAFSFTWICWIPGLLLGTKYGYVMPNLDTYRALFANGFENQQHLIFGVLFSLGVYGPLLGAVIASSVLNGKTGFRTIWQQMKNIQIGWRWIFIAVIISLLLPGIPVLVMIIAGDFQPDQFPLTYILFLFVVQFFTSGLGEEPGWRGFLLPLLRNRLSGDKYIWILGLIWAIWHYPLVIIQTLTQTSGLAAGQTILMIILGLAGQTISLIGLTYIYVWLINKTNSLFLAMLFHAMSNVFSFWLLTFLKTPQAIGTFIGLMPWVIVFILEKKLGKEQFPGTI